MALDYENIILISHEDTSKDITKKGGDKITAIKPNMQDKVALKVAGMVDIVARIVADGDVRTFNFKSNEVIFGGGRLKTDAQDIALDVNELFKVYDEANRNAVRNAQDTVSDGGNTNSSNTVESPSEAENEPSQSRRTGRRKKEDDELKAAIAEETASDTVEQSDGEDSTPSDEPPFNGEPVEKPRTRKTRRTTNEE